MFLSWLLITVVNYFLPAFSCEGSVCTVAVLLMSAVIAQLFGSWRVLTCWMDTAVKIEHIHLQVTGWTDTGPETSRWTSEGNCQTVTGMNCIFCLLLDLRLATYVLAWNDIACCSYKYVSGHDCPMSMSCLFDA